MAESITERVWVTELDRLVRGPAWPLLREWWVGVLVRRVMSAEDPLKAAVEAASDLRGASALMLAIENELSNKSEAIDGRRYRATATRSEERKINGGGAEGKRGATLGGSG